MTRCTRCILPDTYPDITFDNEGVCHRCHEQDRQYLHRDHAALQAELVRIFGWAKRQRKRYDCIVPFSGGKDSSYTLYLCRKTYGLNVLAVNFNNGLRTPEALANIERIVRKTDVALASYGPPFETMMALYRAALLTAGQFCFPCDMGIWATVHRAAEQYDVPLIVTGFSSQIETRGPKIYSYNNKLFHRIASALLSPREIQEFLAPGIAQKVARRLKHGRLRRFRRQIALPDYMEWDDSVIKTTIREELGWESRPDGSSDHVDCFFAPVKRYLNVQKWGFGEKTTKYSAMVRAGQMMRDEALRRADAEEHKDVSGALEQFCKWVRVTPEELAAARDKSHLALMS